MHFALNDAQRMIQQTARRFAVDEIPPALADEERAHIDTAERVAKMGALGFLAGARPDDLGGSGMEFMDSVLTTEDIAELAASDAAVHTAGTSHIHKTKAGTSFGTTPNRE
jgi:glutaryl-CoA dehydrogenase (non-decarboxylating)